MEKLKIFGIITMINTETGETSIKLNKDNTDIFDIVKIENVEPISLLIKKQKGRK